MKAVPLVRRLALVVGLALTPALALAQGAILQGGPWTPGHAPMYVGSGQQGAQTVVQDSGPAGGGGVGLGLSEGLYVARGTGTAPYVAQGTGPLGTNWCNYDAPITNAGGYHYLCMSPNAQGGGLITYGAGGAASALPLNVTAATLGLTATSVLTLTSSGNIALNAPSVSLSSLAGGGTRSVLVNNAGTLITGNATTASSCATNVSITKTATYTVLNTDKAELIALGGSAYYPLNFGAASGYDSNFCVTVVNTDTTRAKDVVASGITTFKLWPLQTAAITNVNNVWQVQHPNRWKTPGGSLNLYSDYINGNDANDCLAPGAGNACKTASGALYKSCDQFDLNGTSAPTRVLVNLAANVNDADGIHWSCSATPGAQGGAVYQLWGTAPGSTIFPASADAVGVFEAGTRLELHGFLTLGSNSGNAVTAQLGGELSLNSTNIQFITSAGSHIFAANNSNIFIAAGYQIMANAGTSHYLVTDGGHISVTTPITVIWGANTNFTYTAYVQTGSLDVSAVTFNLNTFTVTATRFFVANLGVINTNGGGANFIPGNVAGGASGASGGFYNFLLKRDLHHDNDNTPMWLDQAA